MPARKPVTILLADDDEDDRLLTTEALKENRVANPVHCVKNGEELLDYLHQRGEYADPTSSPKPGIILLDLNMPKMDGRESLARIKADPNLRRIPVVILTTSKAEEDVLRSYDLGVNSFIIKPVSFNALVDILQGIHHYWFEIVELPSTEPVDNKDCD